MPTIDTILCPLDFSETSEHALEHAIAIATWYRARLVGLHAYTPVFLPVPELVVAGGGSAAPTNAETVKRLERDVNSVLEAARAAGLRTESRVAPGPAATAILAAAASLPASLLVMGTHGAGGFEHLVLGSVAEKVLRKATCPVLTVPPRARTTSTLPFKRILCPIDFGESSTAALEFALSIAQESDADLSILHVLEWPVEDEPRATRSFNVPEYGRLRKLDAEARLESLVPAGVREWCNVKTLVAHGKAYREILGIAATEHADLIVMGVQGRNALDMMLFGSTTNQVVRRATCPVLTQRR